MFFDKDKEINCILAIWIGVENLALLRPAGGFDFWKILGQVIICARYPSRWKNSSNDHIDQCQTFSTLICQLPNNLHESSFTYVGWENLTSLTYLSFTCLGPEEIVQLMKRWPTVQFVTVALSHCHSGDRYRYLGAAVNDSPHRRELWGVRAISLSAMSEYEWERGARGSLKNSELSRFLVKVCVGDSMFTTFTLHDLQYLNHLTFWFSFWPSLIVFADIWRTFLPTICF